MRAPSIKVKTRWTALACLSLAGLTAMTTGTEAAEIHVMSSGGFTAAYQALVPGFSQQTGHKVDTVLGPSMGVAPDAIPLRLSRGEPADVLIMVGYALDDLIAKGTAVAGSRVDLANSYIGLVVREGQPKPDISTLDAFRKTLLAAKSIAYSDSASGVYVATEMYAKLGLAADLAPKSREIKSERVGNIVARGEAEIGFQQVSELLPVKGVTFVGTIPPEVQKGTLFGAGIAAASREPEAARDLIRYLTSPAARPEVIKSGLEPMGAVRP